MEKKSLYEKMNELKDKMEVERKNYSDKNYEHEKERMQWQMERDVLSQTKHELEDKYDTICQKFNQQQRDLDQYKKPPMGSKIKEATKFAIKDFLKNSASAQNVNNSLTPVLQKNILMKTTNNLSLDRFNKGKDDLNMSTNSGISGGNDCNSTFNETNVLHSESQLTHNGSRKRLGNITNESNTFIKGKMIKKLSLFGNNQNENEKKENQE